MRVLSVSWNPNLDKTKLKFTEEFLTSDWIVRADVLKDILGDINDLYNATVQEEKQTMKVWCNPGESVSEMLHWQSEKN